MIRAHVHSIKAVSAPFAYLADRTQYDLAFPGTEFKWIVFKLTFPALQFIRTARVILTRPVRSGSPYLRAGYGLARY